MENHARMKVRQDACTQDRKRAATHLYSCRSVAQWRLAKHPGRANSNAQSNASVQGAKQMRHRDTHTPATGAAIPMQRPAATARSVQL